MSTSSTFTAVPTQAPSPTIQSQDQNTYLLPAHRRYGDESCSKLFHSCFVIAFQKVLSSLIARITNPNDSDALITPGKVFWLSRGFYVTARKARSRWTDLIVVR